MDGARDGWEVWVGAQLRERLRGREDLGSGAGGGEVICPRSHSEEVAEPTLSKAAPECAPAPGAGPLSGPGPAPKLRPLPEVFRYIRTHKYN